MAESKKTTREKAAAARAAAEASEKRRERAIRIGLISGVVVIVAVIIGATLWSTRDSGGDGGNPNAKLPAGVSAPEYGAPVGTAATPVLDIYEDFQCPACAQFEAVYGGTVDELIAAGKVKAVYHPMNFLDGKLGNDSSTRAAAAFGCAVDGGVALKYHNLVFANQPQSEGVGYTDEQLKSFGAQAGLSGAALDTFNSCFDAQTYTDWPTLSNTAAGKRGVQSTPTLYLNGEELKLAEVNSPEAFKAKVEAAASGG